MALIPPPQYSPSPSHASAWSVFLVFLRLGLTSFGGPVAHLAYFRDEFVHRRAWLSERSYADLVALCQFLPGPASSQVGMALGLSRAGHAGALAAWAGFTLPSAVVLIALALGIHTFGAQLPTGVLHGLKVAALAVVAQAVWSMARSLCPDAARQTLMVVMCGWVLWAPGALAQMLGLLFSAVLGMVFFRHTRADDAHDLQVSVSRRSAVGCAAVFVGLLFGLPFAASVLQWPALAQFEAFYRAGALVFGGGHVVLPLLQAEVVGPHGVSPEMFLAGYGAAQAVPGPLFTFAAFLGTAMNSAPNGVTGGLWALLAIFAPSYLLVVAALPFWQTLRRNTRMQAALLGVNAAVVGLLLAALYQPVWTSTINSAPDFAFAALACLALLVWRLPPWLLVLACAGLGGVLDLGI